MINHTSIFHSEIHKLFSERLHVEKSMRNKTIKESIFIKTICKTNILYFRAQIKHKGARGYVLIYNVILAIFPSNNV